jgi:hypothetical protein
VRRFVALRLTIMQIVRAHYVEFGPTLALEKPLGSRSPAHRTQTSHPNSLLVDRSEAADDPIRPLRDRASSVPLYVRRS